MPTGYTAKLCDQPQTLEEFTLTCARAFGALILMRDDPLSTPVPNHFEVSDYHATKIAEVKSRLELLLQMPVEEQEAKFAGYVAERRSHAETEIAKKNETKTRLEAMVESVTKWQPPSDDHGGLKTFMLDQLSETIRFDGHCSYYEEELETLTKLTRVQWMAKEIASADRDVAYHKKELAEETERTNKRNEWVRQLRESLATEQAAVADAS